MGQSCATACGSLTISNADRSVGSACISERHIIEILEQGAQKTEFWRFGDVVRMETFDAEGQSIFGAIEQRVVRASNASHDDGERINERKSGRGVA